jgi:hypothetical protein
MLLLDPDRSMRPMRLAAEEQDFGCLAVQNRTLFPKNSSHAGIALARQGLGS